MGGPLARLLASRVGLFLALLAGVLLPLAYAPIDWVWLSLLSPALLFAIAAAAPLKRALWAAYLFGLGYFTVGTSWVFVSISRYGTGPVVAAVVTTIFMAVLALFPWAAVYIGRKLRPQRDGLLLWLAFPLAWLLAEWVRSWLLTGFPWLLLGYSQTDTWLGHLAPVTGVFGISLVVAILAGGLAWLLLRPSVRRGAAFAVAFVVAIGGSLLLARDWTEPSGEPLSVALLQGNIEQDKKWSADYFETTLRRYWALNAEHLGADIIVWPEAAIPAWYHQVEDNYLARVLERGREAGSSVVMGIPVLEPDNSAYNAVVSLGEAPEFYHKRHLVPFGEYLPLRSIFGNLLDILGAPMSDFSVGQGVPEPITAAGVPVGASVCYEAAFGDEIAAVLPAAEILVNVSNDAWFGDSLAPHQHLQMMRMRAMETEREVLRATNTGITAIIDHQGRIRASTPQFVETSLTGQATPRQGATPYVRWLNYPVLIVVFAGLVALLGLHWRQRPS